MSTTDDSLVSGHQKFDQKLLENSELFEGDMIVSPKSWNAIRDRQYLWTDGIVPYQISDDFTTGEVKTIETAMEAYHDKTCIRFLKKQQLMGEPYLRIPVYYRFVQRTDEVEYVDIIKFGVLSGCSSHVGKPVGAGLLTLSDGCLVHGVILHELMHAIGKIRHIYVGFL